jgi:ADP-ribose pyrophosphatase YjhB (NUDIX family)
MPAHRKIAVSAVAFDDRGRVLLVQQGKKRRGQWELPGGRAKKHEPILETLIREVREETSMTVIPEDLLGVFDIPEKRFCDLVFLCRLPLKTRRPKPCPTEIEAAAFFAPGRLPKPMCRYTAARIRDGQHGVMHRLPVRLKSKQWVGN